MDKTELLFQMMGQPDRYTDQQWQEILADEECCELYAMMSLTKSAVDAQHFDRKPGEEMVQHEWNRFDTEHPAGSSSRPLWRKIAAAAVIALLFSGIAYAAVRTHGFGLLPHEDNSVVETVQAPKNITARDEIATALPDNTATTDSGMSHLYDNEPLEQIMDDVAAKYDVAVEWQSNEARSLRLYYMWKPSFTLDDVVDMLNHFESIKITHVGNKLIIDSVQDQ